MSHVHTRRLQSNMCVRAARQALSLRSLARATVRLERRKRVTAPIAREASPRDAHSATGGLHIAGLAEAQREQAGLFIDMLLDRNKHMNLTAVRTKDEAMQRHVEDSLALGHGINRLWNQHTQNAGHQGLPSAGCEPALRLVDIGAGAGLPAIVLAILRPDWEVVALDTLQKRCKFMEEVVSELSLPNVRVIWSRAEDAGRDADLRESFDVVTARAVAEARVLAELSLPLVRVGGLWVAAKATDVAEEMGAAGRAVSECGGGNPRLVRWMVSGVERAAIVVPKERSTPDRYPRRAGLPSKRPL